MRIMLLLHAAFVAVAFAAPMFKLGTECDTVFARFTDFKCRLSNIEFLNNAPATYHHDVQFASVAAGQIDQGHNVATILDTYLGKRSVPWIPYTPNHEDGAIMREKPLDDLTTRAATPQQDGTPGCDPGIQCATAFLTREVVVEKKPSHMDCDGDGMDCAAIFERDPVPQQDNTPPYCTHFGNQCGGSSSALHHAA